MYRVFIVLDQGIPDGAHGLLDLGIGIKLVSVELRDDLGEEGLELFPCLCRDRTESKCSTLKIFTSTVMILLFQGLIQVKQKVHGSYCQSEYSSSKL